MARRIEDIEKDIRDLSPEQLTEFRNWYEKFDQDYWDSKIEEDVTSGKLDSLANAALDEHKHGKTSKL